MTTFSATIYIAGESSVHRLDVRSKLILLALYSVGLFFIDTWIGLILAGFLFVVVLIASKISPPKIFKLSIPIYFIVAFTILFNSLRFIDGGLSFTLAGFNRGCFFGIRIVLLVWASLIVCLTSTSMQLTDALNSFLRPLRHLRVPTEDIAMVFSIALRFIPLIAEEFIQIKNAQWSRGAKFDEGTIFERIRSYIAILLPMLVGLFRRADSLAQALEVRCYGYPGANRTSISQRKIDALSICITIVGAVIVLLLAVYL